MSFYRPVPAIPKLASPEDPIGTGGRLEWLPIARLVVDCRYQREIGASGHIRIRQIAMRFDWSKFAPLLVSPIAGTDTFAIIDGQHRAAAALARTDIKQVPCWVIEAGISEQASTFLSINAESARVCSGAMWFARAATGNRRAIDTLSAADAAGVVILKYPKDAKTRRHDEMLAPREIDACIVAHGRDLTIETLSELRKAGEISGRPMLTRTFIRCLAMILKRNHQFRKRGAYVAIADLNAQEIEAKARLQARQGDGSVVEHCVRILREHIASRLGK